MGNYGSVEIQWGEKHFKHPDCVTQCFLNTQLQQFHNEKTTIKVYAHGYCSEERVEYVTRWGGDGNLHNIPVYWDEYLPVEGTGYVYMKEDDEIQPTSITHRQRLEHINNVYEC